MHGLTIYHAWWIPVVIIYYAIHTVLSKHINSTSHLGAWYESGYVWALFAFGLLATPTWLIVARLSKNLVFDGMLYDNLMFLTYVITLLLLKCGDKFQVIHWVGLSFIVLGSVLMRIKL